MYNGNASFDEVNVYKGMVYWLECFRFSLSFVEYQNSIGFHLNFNSGDHIAGVHGGSITVRIRVWWLYADKILAYGCANSSRINTKINDWHAYASTASGPKYIRSNVQKYYTAGHHKFNVKLSTRKWWYMYKWKAMISNNEMKFGAHISCTFGEQLLRNAWHATWNLQKYEAKKNTVTLNHQALPTFNVQCNC